jgi:hypothetical protein
MILFAADNHYGQHSGRAVYEGIRDRYEIDFHEDDWSCFERPLVDRVDLLVLNMIAGTCDVPPPADACEEHVRAYVDAGKPMLLLHGGSAAFWPWDWWRALVGFRWVRGNDPDGFESSTHPVRPYDVRVCKARHPLCAKLQDMSLPEDEIYTCLEQTCPTWTLMETTTDEGTFPMCYEAATPAGGRVLGFLPGHHPEVCGRPELLANVSTIMEGVLS